MDESCHAVYECGSVELFVMKVSREFFLSEEETHCVSLSFVMTVILLDVK